MAKVSSMCSARSTAEAAAQQNQDGGAAHEGRRYGRADFELKIYQLNSRERGMQAVAPIFSY